MEIGKNINFNEIVFQKKKIQLIDYFSTFTFIWSLISCIFYIIGLFFSIFWLGIEYFPDGIDLVFIIFSEIIYLLDIFIKFYLNYFKNLLKKKNTEKSNEIILDFVPKNLKGNPINNNEEKKKNSLNKMLIFLFRILGKVPLVLLIILIVGKENSNKFSIFFIFKLFLAIDIVKFFSKFEKILIYSNLPSLIFYKLFENFLIMIAFTHFAACSWLIVNKFWPLTNLKNGYFLRTKRDKLAIIDKYLDSFVWAVSAMTGASFGDVTPNTEFEIVLSIIMMILGASFYGKVFADFEKIIHIYLKDKLEKLY